LKAHDLGATAIAKALGIGRASVYRVLETGRPVWKRLAREVVCPDQGAVYA
jgi:hypothetical protein